MAGDSYYPQKTGRNIAEHLIVIEVAELYKTYRSGKRTVYALKGVSFNVEMGESVAVAGKSGSGKTTLLNCIGGLETVDQGTIRCAGIDINRLSQRQLARFQRNHVGFVFQTGNLLTYLTVRENLALPLILNGTRGTKCEYRISQLLESIGLPDIGSALPPELSGGETQRVSFARAIAHAPSILLADEPTASLDSVHGKQLIRLMVSLSRQQQCTLVVATHDPEVMAMADRRFPLKDGKREETT
jgi:ABC-type lipoprotein export system ATPase subunit